MKLLFLDAFNNYSNRTIKVEESEFAYRSASAAADFILDFNFDPGDDVETAGIVNWPNPWEPDYLVCFNDTKIDSRWFVMEWTRTREGQFKFTLRRDVIADKMDYVLNADMFITRGWKYDPYVNEDFQCSQLLTKTKTLKDKTKCAWLVGYCAVPAFKRQVWSSLYSTTHLDAGDNEIPIGHWVRFDNTTYLPGTIININFDIPATVTELTPEDVTIHGSKEATFEIIHHQASWMNISNQLTLRTENDAPYHALKDAPYAMFAVPYAIDDAFVYVDGDNVFPAKGPQETLDLLMTYAAATYGGSLYDLQLLPYCPFVDNVDDQSVDISNIPYSKLYPKDHPEECVYLLWGDKSSFEFDIDHKVVYDDEDPLSAAVTQATKFDRYLSPNNNGAFDFNPIKNQGQKIIHVSCTYKPIQPYMRLCPDLIDDKTGDSIRGLICSGDFSLPVCSDQWSAYKRDNINYENAMNRQIDTLDRIDELSDKHVMDNIVSSMAIGAVSGAVTGKGAIGALMGGSMGILKAVNEDQFQDSIREIKKDQTRANFAFATGNIKARDNILTKVSAFDVDNHIWPYIESYSASKAEIQNVRSYLDKFSFKVGKMGRIKKDKDQRHFVAGDIIYMDIPGDAHLYQEIKNEMKMGVRL